MTSIISKRHSFYFPLKGEDLEFLKVAQPNGGSKGGRPMRATSGPKGGRKRNGRITLRPYNRSVVWNNQVGDALSGANCGRIRLRPYEDHSVNNFAAMPRNCGRSMLRPYRSPFRESKQPNGGGL